MIPLKNKFHIGLLGLCLLLFTAFSSPAYASDDTPRESNFQGDWSGVISTSGQGDIPAELSIAPQENTPNLGSKLHYGPPRSCSIMAIKARLQNNQLSFVVNETSGGYCDKLWQKQLLLELIDDQQLRCMIENPQTSETESATFSKQE